MMTQLSFKNNRKQSCSHIVNQTTLEEIVILVRAVDSFKSVQKLFSFLSNSVVSKYELRVSGTLCRHHQMFVAG